MDREGLLVLDVTGEELRALCDQRIKALSAAYERTKAEITKQVERAETLRRLDPHSCREVSPGGADAMLECLRRKGEHRTQEIAFFRDHIALGKTHSVYWRDVRDLLFENDDDSFADVGRYGIVGYPRPLVGV